MANSIQDRRKGERYIISFPIRVRWRGEDGKEVVQEGLTENVGPHGTLVYLPRHLPNVGGKVRPRLGEPKGRVASWRGHPAEPKPPTPRPALGTDNLRVKRKVWEMALRPSR